VQDRDHCRVRRNISFKSELHWSRCSDVETVRATAHLAIAWLYLQTIWIRIQILGSYVN
jgi:hypothetical protein